MIHAVFTNLLLWCNGVMSEAEHFLNNHIRRLSALGYANLTIGKGQGVDCWLVPERKLQKLTWELTSTDERKRNRGGLMEGKVRSAARGAMFVSGGSLLGFRRCTGLLALRPPPESFPNTLAYRYPPWQPPAWPRRLCPWAAHSQGCCNYSNWYS